jgi:alpha-beta hydrolase superfamily lysophospholipase
MADVIINMERYVNMINEFSFTSGDGTHIYAYRWDAESPKAVVQIAHGAVEHAQRYSDFAEALVKQGFTVYADDHRGHGKTAGTPGDVAYFSDNDGGFDLAVEDMRTLTGIIKSENPGLPVFLLGHSMGSLLSRIYASRYGSELSGLVLTGTGRANPLLISVTRGLAKREMKKYGGRHKTPFLDSLVFGTLNKPFKDEGKSAFICSDVNVVEAYRADDYCGNTATSEFIYELLGGTRAAFRTQTFENYPKDLPLFIGAGEFDTMGGKRLSGVKKDVECYKSAGARDVEFHIYKGMRHEILNEKEKQSVYSDIISWLNKRTESTVV